MGDKTKQDWHPGRAISVVWLVALLALTVALVYSVFLPDKTLQNVLLAVAVPILVLDRVRSAMRQAMNTGDEISRLRYSYGAVLAIVLWLGLINSEFFHIDVPAWIYIPIIVMLGAGAIAWIWQVGRIRARQQLTQQKQLDQTKLEPLYSEQAKAEQVKRQ